MTLTKLTLEALNILSKNKPISTKDICDYLINNYKFNTSEEQTRYSVSANLSRFVDKNIIKRTKIENKWYYYLPEYENNYNFYAADSTSHNLYGNNVEKSKKSVSLRAAIIETLKILSKNKPVNTKEVTDYLIDNYDNFKDRKSVV